MIGRARFVSGHAIGFSQSLNAVAHENVPRRVNQPVTEVWEVCWPVLWTETDLAKWPVNTHSHTHAIHASIEYRLSSSGSQCVFITALFPVVSLLLDVCIARPALCRCAVQCHGLYDAITSSQYSATDTLHSSVFCRIIESFSITIQYNTILFY